MKPCRIVFGCILASLGFLSPKGEERERMGGHMHLIVLAIVLCAAASAAMSQPLVFKKGPSAYILPAPPEAGQVADVSVRVLDYIFFEGRVLAPQRDGTLVDTKLFPPQANNLGVVGDLNGDGRLDMFSPGGEDDFGDPAVPSSLLLSQPDGTYRDASALLPGLEDTIVGCSGVGDVNGDGYLDIYVGSVGSETSLIAPYFLLNNGGTSFTRTSSNLPADIALLRVLYFTCALVDVDGDGHPDLVLGGRGTKAPSQILLNDGHGDFTKRPPVPLPPGLFDGPDLNTINLSYVVIDLNGDGVPDLVVAQTQFNPDHVGHGIQALINDGHGGFTDQTTAYIRNAVDPAHNWIGGLAVGDLNGDGIPDIYVGGIILNRDHTHPPIDPPVFAWVSDGLGHWNPMTLQDLDPNWDGDQPINYIFKDIDGDGLPDLILLTDNFDETDPHYGDTSYQTYFNVTPRVVPKIVPIAGVWWSKTEPGSGLGIDYDNGTLIAEVYSYAAGGASQWYLAAGPVTNNVFTATLDKYVNGQCISCAYRGPTFAGDDGTMTITFTSPTTADVSLSGGHQTQIQRYFPSGAAQPASAPVAGVWWDRDESGSGYGLDYQNGVLIVQAYSYLAGGAAQWYLGAGNIANNVFQATLDKYTSGQCISCTYKAPTLVGNDGQITITFTSPTTADIALPGGRMGHIQRYFQP
jgi:hypothetical protein